MKWLTLAGRVGSIELLGIAELASGLTSLSHDGDFLLEAISKAILLDFEVVVSLEVDPEPLGSAEIPRQAESGVSGHRPSTMNDFVDAPWRDTDVLSQAVLGDAHRLKEFLKEDLSWMDGG
jgi:hypothetical protein